MPLLEELANVLVTAGAGTLATSLFLGWMPEMPDQAMCLYETSGFYSLYIANVPVPAMDRSGVQLVVRDASYAAGRARIEQGYLALSAIRNQFLSGRWYASVRPVQAPFALGPDASNRPRFVVNFVAYRAGG